MSDDPSTWWNHTTEESVKLALGYMPQLPYAVLASSLSVRATGERHGAVEQRDPKYQSGGTVEVYLEEDSDEDMDTKNPGMKTKVWGLKGADFAHALCFTHDAAHLEYPLCAINVHDIQRVERILWWLQIARPRAIQLQHVEKLSADEVVQVLDVLFTKKLLVPRACAPLHTNLLELKIGSGKTYQCTNVLQAVAKCTTALAKLDLSMCDSLLTVEGLERFTLLEELDVSSTKVNDLTWLCHCKALTRLHSIKLRFCRSLRTTAGIAGLQNLDYIDLTLSTVGNLVGLEDCTAIRTAILSGCMLLKDASALHEMPHLDTLLMSETRVGDLTFLSGTKRLRKLDLTKSPVQDLTPLQNCCNLKVLILSKCKQVENIQVLSSLVALKKLSLCFLPLVDVAPLAACTKLKILELDWCDNLQSLGALAHLSALERLSFSGTKVEDIAPLAACTRLKILALSGCSGVRSVAALEGMRDLRTLALRGTLVEDIEPVRNCVRMRYMDPVATLATLPWCYGPVPCTGEAKSLQSRPRVRLRVMAISRQEDGLDVAREPGPMTTTVQPSRYTWLRVAPSRAYHIHVT